MLREEFQKQVYNLLEQHRAPQNSSDEDIVSSLCNEVEQKSGKNQSWDKEVANEVFVQFKWILDQPSVS